MTRPDFGPTAPPSAAPSSDLAVVPPAEPPRRRRRPGVARRQAGLTLVEATVGVAVVALLLGAAVPGLQDLRLRRHLEGVAAQLETDLQLARSEAVARNESVRVGFTADATGSCYVLHTGSAGECGCTGAAVTTCSPGATALRTVALPAGHPVGLRSNSRSILFDAVKGTVTPTATIRVTSAVGEIRQVVNVMGRVRSCTPDGGVAGLRAC